MMDNDLDFCELPDGARDILQLLAAHELVQQMFLSNHNRPVFRECSALLNLIQTVPAVCSCPLFIPSKNTACEDCIEIYPLAMLLFWQPPLSLVTALNKAYPGALTIHVTYENQGWPLHIACRNHASLSVIQYLYQQYPAAASTPDPVGRYPLHNVVCALRSDDDNDDTNKEAILDYLFQCYPPAARKVDQKGRSLLHMAASIPASPRMLQKLYHLYPGSATLVDEYNGTPLHWTCGKNITTATTSSRRYQALQQLLQLAPEALDVPNHDSWLPIYTAAAVQSSPTVLQKLLARMGPRHVVLNPDGCQTWMQGWTLLHAAARNNSHTDLIRYLAQTYPWMNSMRIQQVPAHEGQTPWHVACSRRNSHVMSVVQALLDISGRVRSRQFLQARDGQGRRPRDLVATDNTALLQLLYSYASEPLPRFPQRFSSWRFVWNSRPLATTT